MKHHCLCECLSRTVRKTQNWVSAPKDGSEVGKLALRKQREPQVGEGINRHWSGVDRRGN